MNGIAPTNLNREVPQAAACIAGNSIVIFSERSDNGRLDNEFLSDFAHQANGRGNAIYTDCHIGSNCATSPVLSVPLPQAQLSLGETVATVSDPRNIVVETYTGFFDFLFLFPPKRAARLIILHLPAHCWLRDAVRFPNETAQKIIPQRYLHRTGAIKLKPEDLGGETFFCPCPSGAGHQLRV